jgi:hypothetical protein
VAAQVLSNLVTMAHGCPVLPRDPSVLDRSSCRVHIVTRTPATGRRREPGLGPASSRHAQAVNQCVSGRGHEGDGTPVTTDGG